MSVDHASPSRRYPERVAVRCAADFPTGLPCERELEDHVHEPTPCKNGMDERHHAFAPPKFVLVQVGNERRPRRLKVLAQ